MSTPWPTGMPVEHQYTAAPDLHAPAVHTEGQPPLIAHPRPCKFVIVPGSGGVSHAVPHISNVEYVRWLDRAAELHADALGYTRASLVADGRMWFVARHEIDYRAETFPGQSLHAFTWVRTIGRSTSWRTTVILRGSDGAPVCTAQTCWAFVDLATRRPARIPADMAAAFDALEGRPCTLPS